MIVEPDMAFSVAARIQTRKERVAFLVPEDHRLIAESRRIRAHAAGVSRRAEAVAAQATALSLLP
jgi:hypothetical protein